jgi:multiple sugar transport system substrate-binding protein
MRTFAGTVFFLIVILLTAGCANNGEYGHPAAGDKQDQPKQQAKEPVTLRVFPQTTMTDAQFEAFFAGPVKKKYPYITMQLLAKSKDSTPELLMAAGDFPDIVLAGYQYAGTLKQLGALQNLNDYVKKYNVDVNRYEQEPIRTIERIAGGGALPGLPYALNFAVNYYNKDIFDKFGVPYPKDGMTWEQTVELSRQLTRQDGGVSYRGLVPGLNPERVSSAIGVPFIDPKTNKATLNTEGWRQVFNLFATIYNIAGYAEGTNGKEAFSKARDGFMKDKTLAMFTEWSDIMDAIGLMVGKGETFNWDMVTLPNFKEHLGQGRNSGAQTLFVSSTSKHKEEAFLAISHIVDDEVQEIVNRSGKLTAFKKSDKMKASFGTNLAYLKGKNINAIFGVSVAELPPATDYDPQVRSVLNSTDLMQTIVERRKDVNTALREAEEQANKLIEERMQAKK